MTLLALRFSRYCNGVALQHGKVSRDMFPEFQIDSITNGVHAPTWTSEPIQQMLDAHIPAWRRDNLYLRNAIDLPEKAILSAHARAKENLLAEVGSRTGLVLDPGVLTLGFARRVATYKRASLMFTDPERLASIAAKAGGLQIVVAGKAHPQDEPGKALIRQVFDKASTLSSDLLKIVYLENYSWELGAILTAGVGCVGQYAAPSLRSQRHQRHESGPERRPQPVDPGRMVDRGMHRRLHRLGHRRRRQRCRGSDQFLQQARERGGSAVPRGAGKLGATDAHHHGL